MVASIISTRGCSSADAGLVSRGELSLCLPAHSPSAPAPAWCKSCCGIGQEHWSRLCISAASFLSCHTESNPPAGSLLLNTVKILYWQEAGSLQRFNFHPKDTFYQLMSKSFKYFSLLARQWLNLQH